MGGVTITPAQRAALEALRPILPDAYYLAGGVGVAAHIGHRPSRDLDVFGDGDPEGLVATIERLPGAIVTARAKGTLYLTLGGVPTSVLEYRYPLLAPPTRLGDLPVPVASVEDLACMKLSAIAGRGAARDFWDLHAILVATGWPLTKVLDAFRTKYAATDIGHVVRSLVYFGDADSAPLPTGMSEGDWTNIRRDLERRVKDLPP